MKYSKEELKSMAIQFNDSTDQSKKQSLIIMMCIFTGLPDYVVKRKINELANS